jgi:AcrR family transcriptional regulator
VSALDQRRFVEAAVELLHEAEPGESFTIQVLADHMGSTTSTFYQHFPAKSDLLLALVRESVRVTAEELGHQLEAETDAGARVRLVVVECAQVHRPAAVLAPTAHVRAIAQFTRQLLGSRPAELADAFEPLVGLFVGVLDGARCDGVVRQDVPSRVMAALVLETVMSDAQSAPSSGSPESDAHEMDVLWDLILNGLSSAR